MIDLHSHILPGIDDGAESFDDSIRILQELCDQGVTDVVLTPHYINETQYVSPRTENTKLLRELKKRIKENKIDINVFLGNEIYIDDHISNLLKAKKISPLADSEYLLIELPLNETYPDYIDIFGSLMQEGYKVILAHPERYTITQKDFGVLEELSELGVLFQCNTGSFLGRYDRKAEKTAIKLAKRKMIFGMGSDIHRPHIKHPDSILMAQRKLRKYYDEDELEKLLVTNPRKVIDSKKPKQNSAKSKRNDTRPKPKSTKVKA